MLESPKSNDEHHSKCKSPTDLPEMSLAPIRIAYVDHIHSPVTCQCAQRQEDHGHGREDVHGSVLVLGDDCEIVLLEGAELVDLGLGESACQRIVSHNLLWT